MMKAYIFFEVELKLLVCQSIGKFLDYLRKNCHFGDIFELLWDILTFRAGNCDHCTKFGKDYI